VNQTTTSRQARAVQEDALRQAARQLRKDALQLLKLSAFHRFMASHWYGELGLGSDPCRPSAFEAQRAAARIGVAVEQRKRLLILDAGGVRKIDDAHHDQVAAELGLLDTIQDEPVPEEESSDG
jgi:hypothetical protein